MAWQVKRNLYHSPVMTRMNTPEQPIATLLQRFVMRLARLVGLHTIPKEQVNVWSSRACEFNKIAGHYDLSDQRLCGINDGRSDTYNQVVGEIMTWNR